MKVLILIGAFLLAAGVTFAANWLALIPWRRSRDKHWTEQARLLYPVRTAAKSMGWSVPAIFAMAALALWMQIDLCVYVCIAATFGASVGNLSMEREIFPRVSASYQWRWTFINCTMRLVIWSAVIGVVILMPKKFDWQALGIATAFLALWMAWGHDGAIRFWQKFGVITAAPERLAKIATDTSGRMGIPFREVLVIRQTIAQAYAMIATRRLLFTERLLELAADDEIAAICSHELAHLAESRRVRYTRYSRSLLLMPYIFGKPLFYTWGGGGFMALGLFVMAGSRLYRRFSRKMEAQADSMATVNESDTGTYARALLRLHEDNLVPAVLAKATHPNLYDRMLAAGITPDFARPKSATSIAWYGVVLSLGAGGMIGFILFGMFLSNR